MLRKTGIILIVLFLAGSTLSCSKWLTGGGDREEDNEQEGGETSESIATTMPDSTYRILDYDPDHPGEP
ncbi:MAG: hypothetical protein JSU61_02305 [Fidelibacterota bacterium]|nr:MAG: hypothetical protein JSU61_02305 [Candidatus Neomarinimicrobiota bacterium]